MQETANQSNIYRVKFRNIVTISALGCPVHCPKCPFTGLPRVDTPVRDLNGLSSPLGSYVISLSGR